MLSNEELAALLAIGYESRAVEFKSAGSLTDKAFRALVARACMALSNQRDGGFLIVGVDEASSSSSRTGLSPDLLEEWANYDIVVGRINEYADPALSLTISPRELPTGEPVIVIQVHEFTEIPTLSSKDHGKTITRGQLYTRSLAKPESSSNNTQNELREVLTLATEKQLQNFKRMAGAAGFAPTASDADKFGAQRTTFLEEPIAATLTPRAHMYATIHPAAFDEHRIPYEKLSHVVTSNTVRLRGWPFPFVNELTRSQDWIGGSYEGTQPEAWALFQSGQFLNLRQLPKGYSADWDTPHSQDPDVQYLPIWFPIGYIFDAFVFAARMQRDSSPGEELIIDVGLRNARNWQLVVADPTRSGFNDAYKSSSDWEQQVTLPPASSQDDVLSLASETTRELFLRFGWTGATTAIINDFHKRILNQ